MERGFDRYECVITTSGVTSEEEFLAAEGAVQVLERAQQNALFAFNISGTACLKILPNNC